MKTQISSRKIPILHEDLTWLKRPNYKAYSAKPGFNIANDNEWPGMEGFNYVPKNIVSDVLYGNRFDMTMPVVDTVYSCIKKAEKQKQFYFKTSALMMVVMNLFFLLILFHL